LFVDVDVVGREWKVCGGNPSLWRRISYTFCRLTTLKEELIIHDVYWTLRLFTYSFAAIPYTYGLTGTIGF